VRSKETKRITVGEIETFIFILKLAIVLPVKKVSANTMEFVQELVPLCIVSAFVAFRCFNKIKA
jgi:hypothetical protein